MKYLRFLCLVPFLMAFQCEEDIINDADPLDEIGLLGKWEIADEVTNGVISDMLPRCCQFFEFNPDDNTNDFKGFYTYTDSQGLVNSGSFELDLTHELIKFIDSNQDEIIYGFSIDALHTYLTFDFTENGTNFTQGWVKVK